VLKPYLLRLGCTEDDAGPVLQEMLHHHGLLVERAPGVFSFSHLTFQEFFVARYLVTTNTMSVLPDYVASPRWQEVITLSANMLPDASELVLAILERIDTTKMRGIAKRGDLGYEGVLLRSLCLSEAVLSQSVRSPLHRLYLDQHTRVNKIPWESIDLSWRYSKKAGKTMANVGFPKVVRDDVRLTEAMHAFRTTLDTLSLSMPLLRSFEAGYAPKDPGAKAAFASFVHMTTDIVDNGGMYSIRIV
jgi:hypothetical protein